MNFLSFSGQSLLLSHPDEFPLSCFLFLAVPCSHPFPHVGFHGHFHTFLATDRQLMTAHFSSDYSPAFREYYVTVTLTPSDSHKSVCKFRCKLKTRFRRHEQQVSLYMAVLVGTKEAGAVIKKERKERDGWRGGALHKAMTQPFLLVVYKVYNQFPPFTLFCRIMRMHISFSPLPVQAAGICCPTTCAGRSWSRTAPAGGGGVAALVISPPHTIGRVPREQARHETQCPPPLVPWALRWPEEPMHAIQAFLY